MFIKTSAITKNQYFQSLQHQSIQTINHMNHHPIHFSHKTITHMYYAHEPVHLSAHSGIVWLTVSRQFHDRERYEGFILQRTIKINPGTYFNYLSISKTSSILIATTSNDSLQTVPLEKPITLPKTQSSFTISQLYAFAYQAKKAPYTSLKEQHPYCELTIVDQGELETTVDGKRYHLAENELILYQANQIHSQQISKIGTTSYITILFQSNLDDPLFFNRVFTLNHRQLHQLEQLLAASNDLDSPYPYQIDQVIAQLTLFLLSLLTEKASTQQRTPFSTIKHNHDTYHFQQMLDYIHRYPESRVDDLVQHFGISRSTLQLLFKRIANQSPKDCIENERFKKACFLIQNSSYTLKEISTLVGYTSLASFSRAFKKHVKQSPSQYAKKLYHQS